MYINILKIIRLSTGSQRRVDKSSEEECILGTWKFFEPDLTMTRMHNMHSCHSSGLLYYCLRSSKPNYGYTSYNQTSGGGETNSFQMMTDKVSILTVIEAIIKTINCGRLDCPLNSQLLNPTPGHYYFIIDGFSDIIQCINTQNGNYAIEIQLRNSSSNQRQISAQQNCWRT